ncbi:FAD assembly factor SdhE [Roseibaca ekhonensis]|jgi:antitoxin CptB|uniref:FAD assembly factor SdhE n=1 Tax=Roseinatronobacter ekhonensis TaxID=254356 RepID=A0A3B0MPW2_9RHOB|nr:succinate dehydrogenase assembly factor 2 [Roseibaca ekhonensis]SUZ33047.1 FAD assembly factor SdhE [Roseibaca ekhonensis]
MQISPEEARLKRLKMRSWRRGMKEMDLILGPFADTALAGLSEPELAAYESLLEENDQDLYLWVTGARDAPQAHGPMLETIRGVVESRQS